MSWEQIALASGHFLEVWVSRLLLAFAVGLLAWRSAHWARSSFERAATRTAADANARLLAARLIYGAILALGLVWVLGLLGMDQASILATFGAIGLALSLAVQDILKSFFAGLYLLFERPFLIGDEIQVKEHVGRVEHVGFRATSIRTQDNVLVLVPNAIVFAEVVRNLTHQARPPEPSPVPPGELPATPSVPGDASAVPR
jgi:small conductance mechanosensitive channel